jgi:hypothetical protein
VTQGKGSGLRFVRFDLDPGGFPLEVRSDP